MGGLLASSLIKRYIVKIESGGVWTCPESMYAIFVLTSIKNNSDAFAGIISGGYITKISSGSNAFGLSDSATLCKLENENGKIKIHNKLFVEIQIEISFMSSYV